LKSSALFSELGSALAEDPDLVKSVKGTFSFQITEKGKQVGSFHLDFNVSPPKITSNQTGLKSDVTIKVSDDNLVLLADGKLNPMQAFMQGKIKVSGQIALAQKLDTVFKAGKKKMEAKPVAAAASTSALGGDATLKSHAIFASLKSKLGAIKDTQRLNEDIKGTYLFKVTRAQKLAGEFLCDFDQSPPSVVVGPASSDVVVTIDDVDLVNVAIGKYDAVHAFMQGKMKVTGKVRIRKLTKLFDLYRPSKL